MDVRDAGIANIILDVRDDGIYLIIEKESPEDVVHRNKILVWIEDYQIKDVNFPMLNKVLSGDDLYIEEKISSNTDINMADETADVTINNNEHEAQLTLRPPGFNGKKLMPDELREILHSAGVVHGIDENALDILLVRQLYNTPQVVAKATLPAKGEDGHLVYHFKKDQTKQPKLMEDGSVDFHSIDFFEPAYKGQLLVESKPPTPGISGISVTGKEILPDKGKEAPLILDGKNTVFNDDKTELYADASGHIIYHNTGRIEISPVLEIPTDVGTATGDVDFNGTVIVLGGMKTGYSISATGDVEVKGVVEGATIVSQGDVVLHQGVQGLNRARIVAEGDILLSFAENTHLEAGGNISGNALVNCVVKCFGSLRLEGKKGALVGGKIYVNRDVVVNSLGSPMARLTELNVGNMPDVIEDVTRINEELETLKTQHEQLTQIIQRLIELRNKNELSKQKRDALITSIHQRSYTREKMEEATNQLEVLLPQVKTSAAGVKVTETFYIGVHITIGYCHYYNDEVRGPSQIYVVDDSIVVR